MENSPTKILLRKYINNKCTPAELMEALSYIETHAGKKELDTLLEEEWESFEPALAEPDVAGFWYRRITDHVINEPPSKRFTIRDWLKYAAIFFLVAGLGTWLFWINTNHHNRSDNLMIEYVNPKGSRSILLLPDSSLVYLSAGSHIKYAKNFQSDKRRIFLTGEAFFEVKKKPERPFIVHSGTTITEVLGTSFNINSFNPKAFVVAVATGKVSVSNTDKKGTHSLAILTPGEMLKWNPVDMVKEIEQVDEDMVAALKKGNLFFNDETMENLAAALERWYNVKISFKENKIKQYRLSIQVDGKRPVNEALMVIAEATKLKYQTQKNQITISLK